MSLHHTNRCRPPDYRIYPGSRPLSPWLAAEIAAHVRQPVGVLHSDALAPEEWVGLHGA